MTRDSYEENHACRVIVEAELAGFYKDVAREYVVKNNIFNEVASVVFLVIELFDAREGDGENPGIFLGKIVIACYEYRVLVAEM